MRLAATQIAVCSLVILAASALAPIPTSFGASTPPRWRDAGLARLLQGVVLAICTIGFLLPLVSVLIDGLGAGISRVIAQPAFWWAALSSLVIGTASSLLTLLLLFSEVHPFGAVTAEQIPVEIVTPQELAEKQAPPDEPPAENKPEPAPSPQPDFSLLDKPAAATAPPPAAPPAPARPQKQATLATPRAAEPRRAV